MANKRDPNHKEKWSNVQVHKEDKALFEEIRRVICDRLGFKVSFTQVFNILVNHVSVEQVLDSMSSSLKESKKGSEQ